MDRGLHKDLDSWAQACHLGSVELVPLDFRLPLHSELGKSCSVQARLEQGYHDCCDKWKMVEMLSLPDEVERASLQETMDGPTHRSHYQCFQHVPGKYHES